MFSTYTGWKLKRLHVSQAVPPRLLFISQSHLGSLIWGLKYFRTNKCFQICEFAELFAKSKCCYRGVSGFIMMSYYTGNFWQFLPFLKQFPERKLCWPALNITPQTVNKFRSLTSHTCANSKVLYFSLRITYCRCLVWGWMIDAKTRIAHLVTQPVYWLQLCLGYPFFIILGG